MSTNAPALLAMREIVKDYPRARSHVFAWRRDQLRAVDGVSLEVPAGSTIAIVGESGSGKSTLLRIALGIESPTAGEVRFVGRSVAQFSRSDWQAFRQQVQPVLQDPWGALNPRMRVRDIVAEPLRCLQRRSERESRPIASAALGEVGLAAAHLDRYPHEFSGGQRQRIAIARALAVRPRLVLLDEPVSALDVSIRAQIVNLLKDLQEQHRLSYVLVSHDMPTVWSLSDQVVVLYRGRIMEVADSETLRTSARSPYSQRLIGSILATHPRDRRPLRAAATPSSTATEATAATAVSLPPAASSAVTMGAGGCVFRSLCPVAFERCTIAAPELRRITSGHFVACHRVEH